MKCFACGFNKESFFVELILQTDMIDKNGNLFKLFACPKCTTLQVKLIKNDKPTNKFNGCVCPWCKNTHRDEFAITCKPGGYENKPTYRLCCSCGATGPDADSELEAIDNFKRWKDGIYSYGIVR